MKTKRQVEQEHIIKAYEEQWRREQKDRDNGFYAIVLLVCGFFAVMLIITPIVYHLIHILCHWYSKLFFFNL